jgi:hypothetical protein
MQVWISSIDVHVALMELQNEEQEHQSLYRHTQRWGSKARNLTHEGFCKHIKKGGLKLHKLCFEILCKWKIKTYWHSASSLHQVAPCKHTHQRKGLKARKATPIRKKIRGMGIMRWHTNIGDNRQWGVCSDLGELNMSFP